MEIDFSVDRRPDPGTETAITGPASEEESTAEIRSINKQEIEEAPYTMKKTILVVTLVAALLTSIVAPAFTGTASAAAPAVSHNRAHAALFDKTRFLLHAGAAYFAFHHWIYNPYKAHAFAKGAPGRTKAIIKAGIAALFAVHELKVAYGIANGSNSATLHALVAPINKLIAVLQTAGSKFKSNPSAYSDTTVNGLNSSAGLLGTAASKAGYGIKDIPIGIPGL
jgi:hypothetical protein